MSLFLQSTKYYNNFEKSIIFLHVFVVKVIIIFKVIEN